MFSLNIKPQYIPARYFSFCVLLTVLLVTLSIRSLQGELFITDAQYMVAAGRWIIANGHLPTTDPLSIHSELTYICQQYPICILVAVLYDTFGEMSVRLFFALLDMVAVLFIWYQTFPKAGNRILHCAVSCVFGAVIVYSTWCWKLEPKCKVSSKMLSRIVLFSISVVALEFGAVLFYSTLSATDQKSISIERAFQAMREDGAVSGTAVLTDIDPGCRAELNGFKPYLDTRIEVFNGQNGQKNVLAEAGKALSSGSLSAICDDYGMDYAVLNYGINDVGIQDLEESGFKPVYSDNLTVCLKRSTV